MRIEVFLFIIVLAVTFIITLNASNIGWIGTRLQLTFGSVFSGEAPPPPPPACNQGDYRCNGNNLEQCVDGQWQFGASCQFCNSSTTPPSCSNPSDSPPTTMPTTTLTTISLTPITTPPVNQTTNLSNNLTTGQMIIATSGNGYSVILPYNSTFNENITLFFVFTSSNGSVSSYHVGFANYGVGNVSEYFDCSKFFGSTFSVSWEAYRYADDALKQPFRWAISNETKTISC